MIVAWVGVCVCPTPSPPHPYTHTRTQTHQQLSVFLKFANVCISLDFPAVLVFFSHRRQTPERSSAAFLNMPYEPLIFKGRH